MSDGGQCCNPRIIGPAFDLGECVNIDGDRSIAAVVVAICWRDARSEFEVSWFSNGACHSAWFAEWRLSKACSQ